MHVGPPSIRFYNCTDAYGAAERSVPVLLLFFRRFEPPHAHVEREDKRAKFWLTPVRLEDSVGFRSVELGKIQALVEENLDGLLRSWNEFFGN